MAERRKLIEVALPLEAISREAAREAFIYKANPSAVHKWWAQRPLAACRAVLFASLVDDPLSDPDRFPTEEAQEVERTRLFGIIERLVLWENNANEAVLEEARAEIRRSAGGHPPPVLDPFCGGGSIPLEAQRLGLTANASDLNPVAVLITKALIEIPPNFRNLPPVHPDARASVGGSGAWRGAAGLAEDVLHYGAWMRDEAERRIGNLYPRAHLPKEQGGGEATVIAWLWARTVACPNPACRARMPLGRSFALSTKKGKEAWAEPIVDRSARTVRFEVRTGPGTPPEGTVGRLGARCVVCETPVSLDHVRAEGRSGRMDSQLMAIVVEGQHRRIYLTPTEEHLRVARSAQPIWGPEEELQGKLTVNAYLYGLTRFRDLFTPRQLVALTTLSDLVREARERVLGDSYPAGLPDEDLRRAAGVSGAAAYADAIATYLAFAVDKTAEYGCSLVPWYAKEDRPKGVFARQALPMVWDFAEVNPFGNIGGTFSASTRIVSESLGGLPALQAGSALQLDATQAEQAPFVYAISTDPPYYDNIAYADLSDFFYVWLRRALRDVYPQLFATVLAPKAQELIAAPHRFDGNRDEADYHFEAGLRASFARLREAAHPDYPLTIYYAFKQAEELSNGGSSGLASTGWETMLEALLGAGLALSGTWPMRTERATRSISMGANALASSIVLVCRPRSQEAPLATRREFAQALRHELPRAIAHLQRANIAPVDLAQASIGPGMAVFCRYSRVVEADGSRMAVRRALELINAELDLVLRAQEGDLDLDSRWCTAWFETHGFDAAPYGSAETLATAKDVSVRGLEDGGLLTARSGKVQLRAPEAYDPVWDPRREASVTIWRCTHQLIRALTDAQGGVEGAARLVVVMGSGQAEVAKELAYRLFGIADRKGWSALAGSYNQLVTDWPAITEAAERIRATGSQDDLGL